MPPTLVKRRREELIDAAERASNVDTMLAEMSQRLREIIPFAGSCWFGTDPGTLFATLPVRIENIADGHCHTYWEREFLVEDALLFRELAGQAAPAGTLCAATENLPQRSTRYREFMAPQGFSDELRSALRTGGSTWGLVCLLRNEGEPPFTEREVTFMASLSEPFARTMRGKVLLAAAVRAPAATAPGLVMFDQQGVMTSLNESAQSWLEDIGAGQTHPDDPPVAIITVLAHARAVASGRQRGSAMLRVRGRSGRWATLHASCLNGVDGAPGPTAVVIERTAPSDLRPILEQAYGLSAREQQVTQQLARGAATSAIARELQLSEHTIRDHIKTILAKVGVASRAELAAHLFAEHHEPEMHAAVHS